MPPLTTIETAPSPPRVLWLMVGSIGLRAVLLLPSLALLFYHFPRRRTEGSLNVE